MLVCASLPGETRLRDAEGFQIGDGANMDIETRVSANLRGFLYADRLKVDVG